jgi:flagellar biosynthesis GTPase FlhF
MTETRSRETRTYRGSSLEELLPQILEELGPEAVVTKQREGVVGGLGGFFGKRCVEVEVEVAPSAADALADVAPRASLPPRAVVDAYDMGDTLVGIQALRDPEPQADPFAARPAAPAAGAAAAAPGTGSPIIDSVFAQALPFADHLTAAATAPTTTATLTAPGPWDADLDLSQLDGEEFQPLDLVGNLDLGPDPMAEEAREWAKQEIRAMKRGIVEREKAAPADAAPAAVAPSVARAAARAAAPAAAARPAATKRPGAVAAAPAAPAVAPALAAAPAAPASAASDRLPAKRGTTELVAVAATLAEAGLPESLVMSIHKDVAREVRPFASDLPVRAQARAALAKRIKTKSGWRGKRRTIALVGGPGAGKTLTAAKLCHAFAVGGGLSVGALSLESPRAALQFGLLTEGIGVDFQIADLPSQVPLAAGRLVARDLIVVDTPTVDPADAESVDRLESLLLALRPDETHFLVPASADIEPSQALLDTLASRLGIDRILITRLDEAPALGEQVALSISSRVPISYLASGDAPDFGLAPADPVALASMVLP